MPLEVLKKAILTCDNRFAQVYGSTEAYIVTLLPKEDHVVDGPEAETEKLTSCGKPIGDCEVRIVDEEGKDVDQGEVGEIAVRGESVFGGYWRKPEETARALRRYRFTNARVLIPGNLLAERPLACSATPRRDPP